MAGEDVRTSLQRLEEQLNRLGMGINWEEGVRVYGILTDSSFPNRNSRVF